MKIILTLILFLSGLYISLNYTSKSFKDGFEGTSSDKCPDLLVKNGTQLYLLNSKNLLQLQQELINRMIFLQSHIYQSL